MKTTKTGHQTVTTTAGKAKANIVRFVGVKRADVHVTPCDPTD